MSKDSLWEEIAYGLKWDCFDSPALRAALRSYRYGARDAEIIGMLRGAVHSARMREQMGEVDPFRNPRLSSGDIVLGADSKKGRVKIPLQALNAGLFIAGNTGSSKTNFVKFLTLQTAPQVQGMWTSDLYKADLRHLSGPLGRVKVDWITLQPSMLRINPLQADGNPRTHASLAVDLLVRVLGVPPRARTILRTVVETLYEEFGVFRGVTNHWPTLFDVYQRIHAATQLNHAARDAILDRLSMLLTQLTPQCAAYRLAWRPRDLERYHLNFELRGAAESTKHLLLNTLLFTTLYNRVEHGGSNRKVSLCVAFEDAQRLFSEGTEDMPPLDEIAGLIRGAGVSLWGACQTLRGLSRGLLPNLATRVFGRLGSHDDYQSIGSDMGLSGKQIEWAKHHLRPGRMIAQVAEGNWRYPFVLEVPEVKLPVKTTDSEVRQSARTLDALPTKFADEFRNWHPQPLVEVSAPPTPVPTTSPLTPSLSAEALRFLRAVFENPGEPSSAYPKLARLGGRKATHARKQLVADGYLREHKLSRNARGRPTILLEVTASGKATLSAAA